VADNLNELLQRLRPSARINWTPLANLHLTTKFIGQWPEERLPELTAALDTLRQRAPIRISAHGIGWLPNPHSPRILFVGVKAEGGLAALATDTDRTLEPLGVAPETRKYSPHLTLARIKEPGIPLASLRQAIADNDVQDFGEWTARGFHLYLSKPGPKGSVYTQIADFSFPAHPE
jgi:2'-5' RNA ligase